MTSRIGQLALQQARFDDFEAYESSLQGWSPVIRKLDAEPFRARLLQISEGPVRIARNGFDASLAISGTAQPGLFSFGLPMPSDSPAMWCREETSPETVSVYALTGAFEAVTPRGFETAVVSIEPDALAALGETLGYETPRGASPEVLRCPPEWMRRVRELVERLCAVLPGSMQAHEADPGLSDVLERELPSMLLEALASRGDSPQPVAGPLRQRALRRALDYIADHPRDRLGVADLCQATGASERTLRRAFRETLGVGPKSYLQSRRLHGVYRDIRRAPLGGGSVTEVAHRWGFWHMGQFAADYRRLFGERPSETLRRTATAG